MHTVSFVVYSLLMMVRQCLYRKKEKEEKRGKEEKIERERKEEKKKRKSRLIVFDVNSNRELFL